MSEQDEINAERARLNNYEPEEGKDYSGHLDAVHRKLSESLANHDSRPEIRAAVDALKDCAADNPDEVFFALVCAWRNNPAEGISVMEKYIRTYAEAHLAELVEFFQIDTGEEK